MRVPKRVFESIKDGYNIETMYNKVMEFLDEEGEGYYDNYHYSLWVIKTKENDIFGALITASPIASIQHTFRGTFGSFVFTAH